MRNRKAGFTLMEVLVALAIFSIMATGFSHYVSDRAKQTEYLTHKTLAAIVAANTITQLQISPPPVGHSTQAIVMAGKNWLVDVTVANSDLAAIRLLDVSVALPGDSQEKKSMQTLVTLTGFAEGN